MSAVTVYTKPSCVQCKQSKDLLEREEVEYTVKYLTDPMNLAAAKELGYLSAPVLVAGNDHWAGFQPDKIKALAARIKEEGK